MIKQIKTQIGTTKEQSKRLVELGLNPDTADLSRTSNGMLYTFPYKETKHFFIKNKTFLTNELDCTPSWSIEALLKLCPWDKVDISSVDATYRFDPEEEENPCEPTYEKLFNKKDNNFDNLIDCIEWIIKNDKFNKDYLIS